MRERERESIEPDGEFDKGRDSKIVFDAAFHKKSNRSFCETAAADVLANLRPVTFVLRQELTLKVKQVKAKQGRVEKSKAK